MQIATIKRRNPEKTKSKILTTAKEMFAEQGYAQTGLREIAKTADVAPSLIVKHFGTKAGLFEAALHCALDLQTVLSTDKKKFAKTLVQAIFDHQTPITLSAMISLSIGDPEAAAIAGEFTQKYMIDPIAKWLGSPKADARAYLIVTVSTAFVLFNRHLITDETYPAKASAMKYLENMIQDLVDGNEQSMNQFLVKRPNRLAAKD